MSAEPESKKLKGNPNGEVFQPRLRSIKTLWGVAGSDDPAQWAALFAKISAEGFDAVECCVLWFMPGFMDALNEAGLELVAQRGTNLFFDDAHIYSITDPPDAPQTEWICDVLIEHTISVEFAF